MDLGIIFLFALALVWIIFATVQDLKTREISNWISFSLIIFALGFRFFYSLFKADGFGFFYQGFIGLLIFFVLGHALYYGKFFAGGDAKLFIALGPILPLSTIFNQNVKIFVFFFVMFLIIGAVYSLSASFYLSIRNFKKFRKEFSRQLKKNKKMVYSLLVAGLIFMILGFSESLLFYLGAWVFFISLLYVYTKAVDESAMVKKVKTSRLTEGDWLYEDVKVGKNKIKASWSGLSREEIKKIKKKHTEILIRRGIPFSPIFLITMLVLIWAWQTGSVETFWSFLF